jgi:hypothetical protein
MPIINCPKKSCLAYMLKRWDNLTRFLQIPGAPLDNNICERALKYAICHRKNSLFYKTQRGVYVGDLFMSLIHTCQLAGINPFISANPPLKDLWGPSPKRPLRL